jgi:hypothetical protein
MRLIKGPVQLPYPPKACAVTNRETGDFIDFNVVIDRPGPFRLYLRTQVIEDAGRLCGMVPASEVAELREQMAALANELAETQDTMNLLAELEDQIGRERTPA